MIKAISLEQAENNKTRFIVLIEEDGCRHLEDVIETEAADTDGGWAYISENHPDLTHVALNHIAGSRWEAPDCLTVREAAEAVFFSARVA